MNVSLKFFTGIALISLAACSTQKVIPDVTSNNTSGTTDKAPTMANQTEQMSAPNPPMTIMKGHKKLNLARIMDGEICKNELQGVKGAFLLYADANDIKRIKRKKGPDIFSIYETKIQTISGDILQEAVVKTNLSEDPFSLGEDDAQQKLADKLVNNFRKAATDDINAFKKETTLTIDITAFPPSLVFYQKGCEAAARIDSEYTDSDIPKNPNY